MTITADKLHALSTIESQFPKISSRLELLWGSPEFEMYIKELSIVDRDHRQGFPPEIFSAILTLEKIHWEKFGVLCQSNNPWS